MSIPFRIFRGRRLLINIRTKVKGKRSRSRLVSIHHPTRSIWLIHQSPSVLIRPWSIHPFTCTSIHPTHPRFFLVTFHIWTYTTWTIRNRKGFSWFLCLPLLGPPSSTRSSIVSYPLWFLRVPLTTVAFQSISDFGPIPLQSSKGLP